MIGEGTKSNTKETGSSDTANEPLNALELSRRTTPWRSPGNVACTEVLWPGKQADAEEATGVDEK